jgi:type II restriction enzyme
LEIPLPDRLAEARVLLAELGLPKKQQNKISGLTLLALCRMTLSSKWSSARSESLTLRKGIMDYVRDTLGVAYAENSREQFRRQVLHQFVQAGVAALNPDDPTLPTNSLKYHYKITTEALEAIRAYGSSEWNQAKTSFLAKADSLARKYSAARKLELVPVTLADGSSKLELSPGRHNRLQAAIVRDFAPRFAGGARLLYLGDTAKKALYTDEKSLRRVGLWLTQHDKLPDVVLHDGERNWLYLVEAVTSHGPMSPKRILELKEALANAPGVGLIFVSAFPDMKTFKRHAQDIAWDTEVWLADLPDHMMHFNGDRFLGPRVAPHR